MRVGGRARTSAVTARDDWPGKMKPSLVGLDDAARAKFARAWELEALSEHASIASFSRLALDLLAAGAPPTLVHSAHRAAIDEISHARACFSLASAYGGKDVGPGPFLDALGAAPSASSREFVLRRLAVESLQDGCLHEGFAAAVATEAVSKSTDTAVGGVLAALAHDEAKHATLGWDVVTWALAEGGDTVLAAVRISLSSLPAQTARQWVIPGDNRRQDAVDLWNKLRAEVIERAEKMVG